MCTDPLEAVARAVAKAWVDAVETACERSLTDPRGWGVLVITGAPAQVAPPDGDVVTFQADGWIGLHESVPYGEIHYRTDRP